MPPTEAGFLARGELQGLLDALRATGRRVIGPTLRDGAIVLDEVSRVQALPRGVGVSQSPGRYRVEDRGDERLFAWANGPQALKPLVFAPRESLWRARQGEDGLLAFEACTPSAERLAVIGARACDLAALELTDRHFLDGPDPDVWYRARREGLFLVAVDCSHPAETCFCASTGDGPHAGGGFDLALTELDDGFVVRSASAEGAAVCASLTLTLVTDDHRAAVAAQARDAAAAQRRALPGRDLSEVLFANLEHPRWDAVAGRCLACGNCTAVCPTCFCHACASEPALDGTESEQLREWDSCFTQRHCVMHGYKVRPHIRQRYRQWLTHKLGGWHAQYGRSGCTGCGRCIAWCPSGIDLTEEAAAVCAGVEP